MARAAGTKGEATTDRCGGMLGGTAVPGDAIGPSIISQKSLSSSSLLVDGAGDRTTSCVLLTSSALRFGMAAQAVQHSAVR